MGKKFYFLNSNQGPDSKPMSKSQILQCLERADEDYPALIYVHHDDYKEFKDQCDDTIDEIESMMSTFNSLESNIPLNLEDVTTRGIEEASNHLYAAIDNINEFLEKIEENKDEDIFPCDWTDIEVEDAYYRKLFILWTDNTYTSVFLMTSEDNKVSTTSTLMVHKLLKMSDVQRVLFDEFGWKPCQQLICEEV